MNTFAHHLGYTAFAVGKRVRHVYFQVGKGIQHHANSRHDGIGSGQGLARRILHDSVWSEKRTKAVQVMGIEGGEDFMDDRQRLFR